MQEQTPKKASKPRKKQVDTPIADLIKYTPNLESYILANIITKCGKPEGYEGQYKFVLYSGWDTGNIQRARVNIYHRVYNKKKELYTKVITSYFLTITPNSIAIYFPKHSKNTPDIYIDYPTNG